MVISQKINESEMGNRVSKSKDVLVKDPLVKEQRVDGSYNDFNNRFNTNNLYLLKRPLLRYTLMACENRYPIRILSNLNSNYIKNYSIPSLNQSIHPLFVTGFTSFKTGGRYFCYKIK